MSVRSSKYFVVWLCPNCRYAFRSYDSVWEHYVLNIRRHHSYCPVCGTRVGSDQYLGFMSVNKWTYKGRVSVRPYALKAKGGLPNV